MNPLFPQTRLRRSRQAAWSRDLINTINLTSKDLIYPVFVHEEKYNENIVSMPKQQRLSLEGLLKIAEQAVELGIPALALFPLVPKEKKDLMGMEALNPDNLVVRCIIELKKRFPELGLIADIALDPYTSHGQDGLIDENGKILNDVTISQLQKQAVLYAQAGSDVVAPSDMMDGRIGVIRQNLELAGKSETVILSYAAKYASHFYGPFRDAVGSKSSLAKADKKTYQMDFRLSKEALLEVMLDIDEGADWVMVKPGMPYLDIIHMLAQSSQIQTPIFAYQVSGEYAMIQAAAQNGWLDEKNVVLESLYAFKRAGCSGILTYSALDAATWLKNT